MIPQSSLLEDISALDAQAEDDKIASVIQAVKADPAPSTAIVARLAEVLAASGEQLHPAVDITADVASTGGPSSLSTLLTPLYLRAWGATVPKLGVPGRPAGGIDCLAQIPGYTISHDKASVCSVLDQCGYAHFLAASAMAPLDGRMFSLRQRLGAQDVPALVTASLLSKKLAVGIRRAGLDIRVAPWGNFGRTWEEARSHAALFRDVASLLGISAYPVLTDARLPYQPYLGRAESLVALDRVFRGEIDGSLSSHVGLCRTLAAAVMSDRAPLLAVTGSVLRDIFYSNVEAQGGDTGRFERLVETTVVGHRFVIRARRDGFYSLSLSAVRDLFVEVQRSAHDAGSPFPDPIGVILLTPVGSWVNAGDPVASVRTDDAVWASRNEQILNTLSETAELPMGAGYEGIVNG